MMLRQPANRPQNVFLISGAPKSPGGRLRAPSLAQSSVFLHPGSPFLTPVGTPDTLSESGSIKSSSRSRRQARLRRPFPKTWRCLSRRKKEDFFCSLELTTGPWTTAGLCRSSLPRSLPLSPPRPRASRAATVWSNFFDQNWKHNSKKRSKLQFEFWCTGRSLA